MDRANSILKVLAITAFGFVLGARGVVWQTIPAGGTQEVALSGTLANSFTEQGNSAENPNEGGPQGYNLCPAGSATVALTKSAENKALYRFFSSIIATNGAAPTVTRGPAVTAISTPTSRLPCTAGSARGVTRTRTSAQLPIWLRTGSKLITSPGSPPLPRRNAP